MRIPLSWLREFAQVPAEASAEDVMAELVKVGFEEEAVHRPTDTLRGPIVVGQVLSIVKEPQTNGKTINWCQVRVVPEGREQTRDAHIGLRMARNKAGPRCARQPRSRIPAAGIQPARRFEKRASHLNSR